MTAADLGFTPAWDAAGVLTADLLADILRLAAADPGKPPRHWRWLAVREFAAERERLTAAECEAVWRLGAAEPDANLGTAVMCFALYQRGCPAGVRLAAAGSDRPAVRRAADRSRGAG